jgi:molybdopterin-guanine dinucleotide biosynthesis protein A
MIHTHGNIVIESPAPGHFVILGHCPASVQTDNGLVVPLDVCYISPEIPTDILREIINLRNGGTPSSTVAPEVVNDKGEGRGEDPSTLEAILKALEAGNVRIRDLADSIGSTVEEIKELDGQGFSIGQAGWVKLNETEGEE